MLLLTLWSIVAQVTEPGGAMHGFVALKRSLPPWELFYNMFAEWMYGFTWLSVTSLVPTLVACGMLMSFARAEAGRPVKATRSRRPARGR